MSLKYYSSVLEEGKGPAIRGLGALKKELLFSGLTLGYPLLTDSFVVNSVIDFSSLICLTSGFHCAPKSPVEF